MDLRVLFVEDDARIGPNLIKFFSDYEINGHVIKPELLTKFEDGIQAISSNDYDIAVLDLYQEQGIKDEEAGLKVLNKIMETAFIPVIFYTGHSHKITQLKSLIVSVVNKGDGIKSLGIELERIISSKLALIKGKTYNHLKESLRLYFWDSVNVEKAVFQEASNEVSLGYLLLRRYSNSLTKENIKNILGDDKINTDKVHPMEFYVYPINPDSTTCEYQSGEILEKDGNYFAILTPDCDLIARAGKGRKADKILLAGTVLFKSLSDYKKYNTLNNKENRTDDENVKTLPNLRGKVKAWMSNRGGEQDRYFFLPRTPFIESRVIDFQDKQMVTYSDLKSFTRVAQLDQPFAQSMIATFIRYYNRIGFPDLDTDYLIDNL